MMNAKTILLESLDERWRKFRLELKVCREEFSEESVHDLRVAARRLLAFLDLLSSIIRKKYLRKVRRTLKDLLDDLDDLRDIQVMLADISEFIREVPEMKTLQTQLLKEEKKLLRLTKKLLKSYDEKSLKKRMGKVRGMIHNQPEEALPTQIIASVDDAFSKVMQAYSLVDVENIPGIHKLRIAFKRFRYSVEIAHPLLADFPPVNFERMHDYQARMGDIQDMEVARQKLTELKPASYPDLETVSAHYASRLRTAVLTFLEDKGEVLVFWRSSPDQSFPWEK